MTIYRMLCEHLETINDCIKLTKSKKFLFRKKRILLELKNIKNYISKSLFYYKKNMFQEVLKELNKIYSIDLKKHKYYYLKNVYILLENDLNIIIKGIEGEYNYNLLVGGDND